MFRPGNLGHLGRLGLVAASQPSLITQALAILAKYGAAANLYLPGVGAINGITAGNWLDSAGTTAATVDGQVGRVDNALSGVNLTQATTANKPILRRGLVNLMTYSHDLANAAWSSLGGFVKTLEPSAGPNGTAATRITATSTPAAPVRSAIVATATAHTYAYIYKPGTYLPNAAALLIRNDTTSTILPVSITTVALGGEWVLACCSASSGINVGNNLRIYLGATSGIPEGLNYQIASVGFFDGAVTAQQIIDAGGIPTTTTAPASSTNGPFAWQFDGGNDRFYTQLSTVNSGWICAGAKLNTTAIGCNIYANGSTNSTDVGVWVRVPNTANFLTLLVSNGATREILSTPYVSNFVGVAKVFSAGWDPTLMLCALNNAEVSQSKTVDCTTSKLCEFGGFAYAGWYSNGDFYPLISMSVLPTVTERATLRQFIASLSGVTL